MKLGLLLGFWGPDGPPPRLLTAVRQAEALGYESVWTSEGHGSDALTPLAWVGAHTTTIRLGTAMMHMAARAPTATAMAALSLDHLSGGRFVLGLGLSGPDLVKGWYGQPFDPPLGRTRDYLAIVRRALAADAPLSYDGEYLSLPFDDRHGRARALTSIVNSLRPDLPLVIGAEGPKNVALAREIADGWIATYYSPYRDKHYGAALDEGAARPGARRASENFEIIGTVPVAVSYTHLDVYKRQLLDYLVALTEFLTGSPAGLAYRALLGEAQHDPEVRELLCTADVLAEPTQIVLDRVRPVAPAMPEDRLAATQLYGPILAQVLTTGSGLTRSLLKTHANSLLYAWQS